MNWSSELAWFSSSLGTSCGTIASNAGPKNAVGAEHRRDRPSRARARANRSAKGRAATLSARSASAAIITRRRSNRSLTTPPINRKTICGTVIVTPTIESAVGVFERA